MQFKKLKTHKIYQGFKQYRHLHGVDKNTKQWAGTESIGLLDSGFGRIGNGS